MDKLASCTPANFRKFIQKFLESSKGNGPYVDCLVGDVPYVPKMPSKMDSFLTTSNMREETDPLYDPMQSTTERIYLYIEPIFPKQSDESKDKDSKAPAPGPIRFDWTTSGQRDLAKAYHAAELVDISHRNKRDVIVSQLLAHLSVESMTLLSNIPGFTVAVQTDDLW